MSSREIILGMVQKNQPQGNSLPEIITSNSVEQNLVERFSSILTSIGGEVVEAKDWNTIAAYITQNFKTSKRIVSTIPQLSEITGIADFNNDPHLLEDVDLAILQGHLGVAENGAIWITEDCMGDRALPFITQQLALVISKNEIVPTLHQAYNRIGSSKYNFGTFIAGPSKTADIEQSLVLGAHGPKSLVVFLLED
jgi:L-lactate dehydrogenase complex protein LldG